MNSKVMLAIVSALSLGSFVKANAQATVVVEPGGRVIAYRVVETSRTVQAVDYQHRSGATDVDFVGTTLMPAADGKARVHSKIGTIKIDADFGNLQAPTAFGGEYLTYVLWAISPQGRAANLGEIGEPARAVLLKVIPRGHLGARLF